MSGSRVQSSKFRVQINAGLARLFRAVWIPFAICTLNFELSACSRPAEEPARGRNHDVAVQSSGGRIEALLGSSIPVATARAAAEQTLRARGYVITETHGTRDRIKIEASGTGERRTDRTTVEAWAASDGTRVLVDSGLFSTSAAASGILDEILVRLGR